MRRTALLALLACATSACPEITLPFDAGPLPPLDVPPIDVPPLPTIDLASLPLPRAPDGHVILIEIANSRIELDPTASDAVTAVGTCTDLVGYCVGPGRSLAACVAATPPCATAQPWTEPLPCCPSACKEQFGAAVDGGEDALLAFDTVFFRAPACFPGVADALAGR